MGTGLETWSQIGQSSSNWLPSTNVYDQGGLEDWPIAAGEKARLVRMNIAPAMNPKVILFI